MATVSTVMKETTSTVDATASSSSSIPIHTIVVTSTDTKNTESSTTENTTTNVVLFTGASGGACADINWNVGVADVEDNAGDAALCVGRNNRAVSFGFSTERGRRPTMEDVVAICPAFLDISCKDFGGCTAPYCRFAVEKSPVHFFGLFDGHGGEEVSSYCANELSRILAEEWGKVSTLDGWNKRWEVALCNAYETADHAFKDEAIAPKFVGSTALVLIVSACQIIAANCGDSRAVLCRGTHAIPLTVDHKLDREDELERITSNGGRILNWGCPRVEGVLSMSRAIGDLDLKQWVISVPEVTFTARTDEDEFLILASDGLWDVLSNEEVVKLARRDLRRQRRLRVQDSRFPPAWYVSRHMLKQAFDASSYDNISIIIVDLKIPSVRPQQRL